METAPPGGHMDTAPPAGHMDTAPPAGHTDTAPPAGPTDTAPPAGNVNTPPPAGHMDIAPPAGHTDTAPPAGHMDTAPPAGYMDTAPPAGHMDTAPPAGHMDTAPPAGNMDTAPPAGHTDTAPPAGHMDTALPAGHMDTAPPAGHMDTAPPAGHMDTAPPAGHTDTAPHVGHMDTVPPASHMDTVPPAGHTDTMPPAGHKGTAPPADETGVHEEQREILGEPSPGAGEVSCCAEMKMSLGIFCWDRNTNILSLANYLVETVSSGSVILVSAENESFWRQVERFPLVIIICQSQTRPSSMKRFLDFCYGKQGAENMIMVIVDPEGTESQKRKHSEWEEAQSPLCPLVTLTEAELDVIGMSDDVSTQRRMADKVKQMRQILQVDADNSRYSPIHLPKNKPVIGIFSREAESQYSWLVSALRTHRYKDHVPEVRPFNISNSGSQEICEDLSLCKFCILYHSKNRGRINVTDETGSLYDDELKHLSSRHGKKNVIVVIDDLEDSSDEEKCRILKHQPTIGKMASGLFLISLEEKKSNYQSYLMVDREQAERKLQMLREEINKRETVTVGEGGGSRMNVLGRWIKPGTKQEKKSKGREHKPTVLGDHVCEEEDGKFPPVPGGSKKLGTKQEEESKVKRNTTEMVSGGHQGEDSGRLAPVPAGSEEPGTKTQQESKGKNHRDNKTPDVYFDNDILQETSGQHHRGPRHQEELQTHSNSNRTLFTEDKTSWLLKSIGIFSRSSESEYSWLKMLLESQDLSNHVKSVRCCPISNVFSEFCKDVSQCEFGILYHSKNRGRINVTDVTDALYDDELEYLSSRLGKKNVAVVIDDLEDASDAMKNKLLRAQHSIEKLARDLILVQRASSEEKRSATIEAFKKVLNWKQKEAKSQKDTRHSTERHEPFEEHAMTCALL